MSKLIATRGQQYPLVAEFTFNFDDTMVEAVQAFQLNHGVLPSGIVAEKTIAQLNVPAETRLGMLRENLPRSECSILIAGFQAAGTLGRRLVDGARLVRIFGDPAYDYGRLEIVQYEGAKSTDLYPRAKPPARGLLSAHVSSHGEPEGYDDVLI